MVVREVTLLTRGWQEDRPEGYDGTKNFKGYVAYRHAVVDIGNKRIEHTKLHHQDNTPRIALAAFSAMEARGAGSVTGWVVEEDARLILLSPPPGAVCEWSISSRRDDGATARGRAPPTEFPLGSLPVRDASRRRRPPRCRGRRHEAGSHRRSFLSARSQSGMRAGDDVRRDDGATVPGRAPTTEFPLRLLPVRDASRRRRRWYQPDTERGRSNQRSALDRADPQQCPP